MCSFKLLQVCFLMWVCFWPLWSSSSRQLCWFSARTRGPVKTKVHTHTHTQVPKNIKCIIYLPRRCPCVEERKTFLKAEMNENNRVSGLILQMWLIFWPACFSGPLENENGDITQASYRNSETPELHYCLICMNNLGSSFSTGEPALWRDQRNGHFASPGCVLSLHVPQILPITWIWKHRLPQPQHPSSEHSK